MSFKIIPLVRFQKDVKNLRKKFPKIKVDLERLILELDENPILGIALGNNLFKIRLSNSSIPSGKSSGFRVVTYYKKNDTLYLITIYSKNDKDSISIESLQEIIKEESIM